MIRHELLADVLSRSHRPWEIECIDCIDSTNLELCRRYSSADDIPHLILWSEEQTEGRGRLARKWFSITGSDITASVVFPSPVPRADIAKLNLCAALALVDVLQNEYGIEATSRWPNDVLTQNGKLAGILSTYIAESDAVVCGIGINVNSRPEAIELGPASGRRTTMLAELGRQIEREVLLGQWLLRFESLWDLAHSGRADELIDTFNRSSFYKGKPVRVLIGAGMDRDDNPECEEFEGVAGSIDETGTLLVNLSNGTAYPVRLDDVLIPLE
jgi:BirA family biotin operon repressor/biotin-[acetyl-CoA-carboxylase] ligase